MIENNIESAQLSDIVYDPSVKPFILCEIIKFKESDVKMIEVVELTTKKIHTRVLSDMRLWTDLPD